MTARLVRFFKSLSGGRLIVAVIVLAALVVTLGRAIAAAYVEILWQAQAGYAPIFWRRILWQWGARLVAGVAVAGLVFANLRLASETLGGIQIKRRFGNIEISEQLPRSYVMWAIVGTSVLLGLWFGAAVSSSLGLQALLMQHAGAWGMDDPVLGHDLGFYVFTVPVLRSLTAFGLIVTFLVFTLAAAAYAATGALRWGTRRIVAQDLTRLHLGLLAAVFFVLLGGRVWLSRYLLLLDGNSGVQGIFGYADAQARLPALQTLTIICVLAAGGTLWGAFRARAVPLIASAASVAVGALLIGEVYPSVVQDFRVEPNELERETPYIEHNLELTRFGFGLGRLTRQRLPYRADEPVDWTAAARQFAGMPVWNRGALLTTYRELEARFPYYDFADVTIDRYAAPGGSVPVAISVREIDPQGIQDANWQNLHLREQYIEGEGAVVSLAARWTPEGRPRMALTGIPPQPAENVAGLTGIELTRPQVYYGVKPQNTYVVVTPDAQHFLAPDGEPGVEGVDFPRGIPLSSRLRTLVFAWRFRDANLVFASDLTPRSRFLFRRTVLERVRAIAPFLRFPDAPYPVISGGRIVWIVEGFTATRSFPLSSPAELGRGASVSYVRNSIKVTVDAISGEVTFYRADVDDPIADALAVALPGLIRPIDEMPAELRAHVRYPSALLRLQAGVLLQYHQETAPVFHGQRDVWAPAHELGQGTSPISYLPEYGLYALPGEENPRFHLTTVFVPAGRQNLTAVLAARTDEHGAPELVLFEVPVQDQVQGPRQVEALVEQDPDISQQFSLWRTGGSEVWTGHLHLVPVGHRLLYIEPVFLAAAADAIPELRRFVLSDGRRVVMAEDLATAIAQLSGREVPTAGGGRNTTGGPSGTADAAAWAEARRLLEEAEASMARSDWEAFADAMTRLKALLEKGTGTAPGGGR